MPAVSILKDEATAPLPTETYVHLARQVPMLYKAALKQALMHQIRSPGTALGHKAKELSKRIRVFDPELPAITESAEQQHQISAAELPEKLEEVMKAAFECCDNLLEARGQLDTQKAWTERARFTSLRNKVSLEVASGQLPKSVMYMLDVAYDLATYNKPVDAQELLAMRMENTSPPRRPGA